MARKLNPEPETLHSFSDHGGRNWRAKSKQRSVTLPQARLCYDAIHSQLRLQNRLGKEMTENQASKESSLSGILSLSLTALFLALLLAALLNWKSLQWHELLWLLGAIAMFAIRAPFSKKNAKNTIINQHRGLMESFMLMSMLLTMSLLPLLYLGIARNVLAFADFSLPDWVVITGVVLTPLSLWLFWRSHADLGRNWSPALEIRKEHELVSTGIYRRLRHPMYAAIWLIALAQPCLLHNWIAGFLVVPAFLLMYIVRIPHEEEMMKNQFGSAYEDYMARTGRIWPKFSGEGHNE